jgi:hypothetical protein
VILTFGPLIVPVFCVAVLDPHMGLNHKDDVCREQRLWQFCGAEYPTSGVKLRLPICDKGVPFKRENDRSVRQGGAAGVLTLTDRGRTMLRAMLPEL